MSAADFARQRRLLSCLYGDYLLLSFYFYRIFILQSSFVKVVTLRVIYLMNIKYTDRSVYLNMLICGLWVRAVLTESRQGSSFLMKASAAHVIVCLPRTKIIHLKTYRYLLFYFIYNTVFGVHATAF